MDFRGEWFTEQNYFAVVECKAKIILDKIVLGTVELNNGGEETEVFLGTVQIGTVPVHTWWKTDGNHINPHLNLSKKKRGAEDVFRA